METLESLHFDRSGFLDDPARWNEAIAEEIARQDEVGPLTPTHWQITRYLRDSWMKRRALPSMSHTCHLVGRGSACLAHCRPA